MFADSFGRLLCQKKVMVGIHLGIHLMSPQRLHDRNALAEGTKMVDRWNAPSCQATLN